MTKLGTSHHQSTPARPLVSAMNRTAQRDGRRCEAGPRSRLITHTPKVVHPCRVRRVDAGTRRDNARQLTAGSASPLPGPNVTGRSGGGNVRAEDSGPPSNLQTAPPTQSCTHPSFSDNLPASPVDRYPPNRVNSRFGPITPNFRIRERLSDILTPNHAPMPSRQVDSARDHR